MCRFTVWENFNVKMCILIRDKTVRYHAVHKKTFRLDLECHVQVVLP